MSYEAGKQLANRLLPMWTSNVSWANSRNHAAMGV
jgi:hypothetical protein